MQPIINISLEGSKYIENLLWLEFKKKPQIDKFVSCGFFDGDSEDLGLCVWCLRSIVDI